MPERPLLLLGEPSFRERTKRRIFPPRPKLPSAIRQKGRFGPKFERLQSIMSSRNATLNLQQDPSYIAPDRALVFEVAGSLTDFSNQAARAGFTFLGEFDSEFDPDEDFYFDDDEDKKISSTIYLVMPDLAAMGQLMSLWERYTEGKPFERGQGQWKYLFSQLHEIRPWSPSDRITTGFLHSFRRWFDSDSEIPFKFEMDLWYSDSADRRNVARQQVMAVLDAVNGTLHHESVIPEINYHGILADISREAVGQSVDFEINPLSNLDSIMFLNPRAMSAFEQAEPLDQANIEFEPADGQPVAALIDGYPLSNHELLEDCIVVDDFADLESLCPANSRNHGTAMASLILHGDLHDVENLYLKNKLLVLPILRPDPNAPGTESTPDNVLAIDLIYRAVRRLKEGDGINDPIGSDVVIINHSLADQNSPYVRRISPWARLLDFLSYEYNILFIVSAGNHPHKLQVVDCPNVGTFEAATREEKYDYYHKALAADMRNRPVYSPAEALNPLTVGAWHSDACDNAPPQALIDILPNMDGPSVISAVGLGHKRAVKPDLFYDGGRVLVRALPSENSCSLWPITQATRFSGQKVAAPSSTGEINRTTNICGTSNAAALVTRQAILINQMLIDFVQEGTEQDIPASHHAVLIKALLVHGCEWGAGALNLEQIIEPQGGRQWQPRRTNIARFLGLGRPDIERVLDCTAQRATMFGWGNIEVDQRHDYAVPLPDELSNKRDIRRVTVTIAWLSPVNVKHQQYRQASLEVTLDGKSFGAERRNVLQTPGNTVGRGTVLHHIFEGKRSLPFEDFFPLSVSCKQQAGNLDETVPYAIAVSFEVGVGSTIDVYSQIRTKLEIAQREPIVV